MKIKSKRLIIAVCMLLVSATMLSTASFAWFSMNTEVSVDGIEVEAYSDALFLEIATVDNDSAYKVSASIEGEKQALRLVTLMDVQSNLVYLTISPTSGYYTNAKSSNKYYVMGKSSGDDLGNLNLIKIDNNTLTPATDLTTLHAVCFEKTDYNGLAVADTTYYAKTADGQGYEVKNVAVGAKLYNSYVAVPVTYYTRSGEDGSYVFTPATGIYEGDSVADKYEINFVEATTGAPETGVSYFTVTDGVYTEADMTSVTDLATGTYYKAADEATLTTALGADAKHPAYYDYNDGTKAYTIAEVTRGSDLAALKLYAIAGRDNNVNLASVNKDLYLENGDDFTCIFDYESTTKNLSNEFFWGKAYSDTLGQVQDTNTLSTIKKNFSDYYYKNTVYLRNAENTNTANNLKIAEVNVSGRANELSPALRVLFVATNGAGQETRITYDNGTKEFSNNTGLLFNKILGNKGEVVKVDMYVYFDGTDDSAYTKADVDAGLLNGQSIEVKFTIDGPKYND